MAGQGLRSVVVKKYSRHASHGSIPDDKVNILKRDFGTETINPKWCTDITCIHVQKEGWTYLASDMDLCSRKITGYAYGTSMTAEPAVKAVENGCMESFHSVLKKEEKYLHTTSFVQSIDIDPSVYQIKSDMDAFQYLYRFLL
jgi:transposase InsO family protein